jgi:hypothetical protein
LAAKAFLLASIEELLNTYKLRKNKMLLRKLVPAFVYPLVIPKTQKASCDPENSFQSCL